MTYPIRCPNCRTENSAADLCCARCGKPFRFAESRWSIQRTPTATTWLLIACLFFGIVLLPWGIGALPLGVAIIGTVFNWGKAYRCVWVRGAAPTRQAFSGDKAAHRDLEWSMRIIGLFLLAGAFVLMMMLVIK